MIGIIAGNMGTKYSKETDKNGKSVYEHESIGKTKSDHQGPINCMSVSEDGSLLITGSDDNTVKLWSTKTLDTECLGVMEGHTGYITCVVSCDTFVISGSADCTIKKWDMTTCQCVFTYTGHTSRVSRIICTGEFIFSSSYDRTARAWLFDPNDLAPGNESDSCVGVFKGHQGAVYPIIFVPSLETDAVLDVVNGGNCAQLTPSDLLLTGSNDKTVKSWQCNTDTPICKKTFRGHMGPVSCMATDHDGVTLFTSGPDRMVKVWTIDTAICQRTISAHTHAVICLQVVNKMLYTGSADGSVKCWITEFGQCTRNFGNHQHSVICLKVADGVLFTGCGDTMARAFDTRSGGLRRTYKGHQAAINCIQYVDGKLYTGSSDGVLKVWDAENIAENDQTRGTFRRKSGEDRINEETEYYAEQERRLRDLERRLRSVDHSVDIKKFRAEMAQIMEQNETV